MTLDPAIRHHHYNQYELKEIQIAAHRNGMTECSEGMLSHNNH